MNFKAIECNGPFSLTAYVDEDDVLWFQVKELCNYLGIKQPAAAVKPLDDDEKMVMRIPKAHTAGEEALQGTLEALGVENLGVSLTHTKLHGGHTVWFVNECGLHTLIQRSRTAVTPGTESHRFRKWVNGEVVPSIRKYGRYIPSSDSNAARRALQDLRAKNLEEAFEQLPTHELNSIIRDQASKSPQFKASFSEHLKKIEPIDDRKVMRTLGIMNPDVFKQRLVDSGIKTEGGTLTDLGKQFCVAANISEKWDPSLIDHIRFCA